MHLTQQQRVAIEAEWREKLRKRGPEWARQQLATAEPPLFLVNDLEATSTELPEMLDVYRTAPRLFVEGWLADHGRKQEARSRPGRRLPHLAALATAAAGMLALAFAAA